MRKLEIDQNEIILLKKLVELHINQLDLYNVPTSEDKLKEKGNNAIQAINKSTANGLLKKIDNSINNQN
jgi:hypothetical protein